MSIIVTSTAEMTADWFNDILSAAGATGGARVTRAATAPIGGGAIARMVRATLTYDGPTSGPESVVVKFPSDDPGSRGLAKALGMYEVEVSFYRDVAPLVPEMSIPHCLAAEADAGSGMFTLVLEDLSSVTAPLANVGAGSSTQDMLAACEAALAELVKFQAPLWNSPRVAKLDWLSDPRRAIGMFDAMGQGLEPFLARFGGSLDPEHVAFFRTYLPRAGEWVRGWSAPTVVQHGD